MSAARTMTTRCHDMHPRINQHHELMVDCWQCLIRTKNNHGHTWHPRSHWRWSFHANSKEVPSLTIKTVGISLTKKQEQLFAMPLEDKDNQGGIWVCISNEPQLINQGLTKSRKVDERRACNYPYPHLQDWMVQRKAKGKKRSCSMDLKPWSSRQ